MSIIMKFGGTSVANTKAINQVVAIVRRQYGKNPVVITSALAGVTDLLLFTARLAAQGKKRNIAQNLREIEKRHVEVAHGFILSVREEIIREISKTLRELERALRRLQRLARGTVSKQQLDFIAAFGERLASWLLAGALLSQKIPAQRVDSRELMATDSNFGSAEVDFKKTRQNFARKILPLIKRGVVPVITGFIGSDTKGHTTTLGRGGSDYSAAIAAVSLRAKEIQIWKDVKGFMTADPRVVTRARVIPQLSFPEAAELSYFGAKLLHPKTIHPAIAQNIPVRILNTFASDDPGTVIYGRNVFTSGASLGSRGFPSRARKGRGASPKRSEASSWGNRRVPQNEKIPVRAIAYKKGITVINVTSLRMLGPYGFLGELFRIFSAYHVPVDVVTTSEVSVSMTIEDKAYNEALATALRKIGAVEIRRGHVILSLVGVGLKDDPRVEALIFETLGRAKIPTEMISKGASSINFTCIIEEKFCEKAVRNLHQKFFP